MKRILVATDLSPRSDRAVQRAFRLAKGLGASLEVVAVIDNDLPADIARQLTRDKEARLAQFAGETAKSAPCDYATIVVAGDASTDVARIATESKADLVVLGIHRRRAFADQFRDTTMERIIRGCRAPVLVVSDPADHDYAQVLLAMDYSPAATAALRHAAFIAPAARLIPFHAVHVPFKGLSEDASRAMLREAAEARDVWMRKANLPAKMDPVEIVEGGIHAVFERLMASRKPDLVALGAHSRAGLAPWILGSFATDVMREAQCDTLFARAIGD